MSVHYFGKKQDCFRSLDGINDKRSEATKINDESEKESST